MDVERDQRVTMPVTAGWIFLSEVSLKSDFELFGTKTQHISYELKKKTWPRWVDPWAGDTVNWYWSADALFWQLSIDYNIDIQYLCVHYQFKPNEKRLTIFYEYGAPR